MGEADMAERFAAPLSVGQVLDAGLTAYRRAVLPGLPLTAALAVLLSLPALAADLYKLLGLHWPTPQIVVLSGLIWLPLVFVYAASQAALIRFVDSRIGGYAPCSVREAFAAGWPLAGRYFLTMALVGFACIGGCVLLVIPGLIVGVGLCLAGVTLVVEGLRPSAALAASWRLVKGYWWRTSLVVSVASVIYFAVELAMLVVGGVAFAALRVLFALKPETAQLLLSLGTTVIGVIVSSVLGTLIFSILVAHYHDLRVRKSGSDLHRRIAALAPAPGGR
jgi:hypothetical protein